MTLMEIDIMQQPEAIKSCRKANLELANKIAEEIRKRNVSHIIVAARGSSDHACNYFKYLCEIFAGMPVAMAAPSVFSLYGADMDFKDAAVIGVSQSGQAEDVMAVMQKAKEHGALTVAVTNVEGAPMAQIADFTMYLNAGDEKCVAATKTFTAQLYSLALIAAALSDNDVLKNALEEVPAAIAEVIKLDSEITCSAKRYMNAPDCYILGRGISYAAAQEAALKMQETTYIKARAYATSDFHHGPFAVMDDEERAIVIAPNDRTMKDSLEIIAKIKATGADLTVLTDNPEIEADNIIKMPSCNEFISPFAYAVCAQLFVCRLSVMKGLNPDSPRGLKKVTITL